MRSASAMTLAFYFLFAAGCKKVNSRKIDEETSHKEQPLKKFLPSKFESDNLTITFKYQEYTANLIEIEGTDGYKMSISYKDRQPFEIKKYKNNEFLQLTDYVKENGLPKARSFDKNGAVYTPTGYYLLYYEKDDQLEKIGFYKSGALLKEASYHYTSGNLTRLDILDFPDKLSTLENTYDEKNGIFRYIKYAERIFLESRYTFLHPGQNNLLSSSRPGKTTDNISCNYEYNAHYYPAVLTFTENGRSQKFKITYTELKE